MSSKKPEVDTNSSKDEPSQNDIYEDSRYLNERKLLYEGEASMAKSFDSAILTIASGVLALSLTFIREIAPQRIHIWILLLSWLCFSLCILAIMISFLLSMKAFQEQRIILKINYEKDISSTNKWNIFTKWANIVSMLFLLIGFVTLAIYVAINLSY